MARVITPSGDEVRTVYSSGGFAAGDYVFQTASGFEKAQGTTPFPFLLNATWNYNQLGNIGMALQPIADYLLGPSQAGGAYTGPAFVSGYSALANTVTTNPPTVTSSNTKAVRLSNGDYLIASSDGSTISYRVMNSTFTTTRYASNDPYVGSPAVFSLLPDNFGGCVIVSSPSNYLYARYLANTATNTYAISNSVNSNYRQFPADGNTIAMMANGIFVTFGYDADYNVTCSKFSYIPNSATTPTNITNAGIGAIGYSTGTIIPVPRNQLSGGTNSGSSVAFIINNAGAGTNTYIYYDGNNTGSTSGFSLGSNGVGGIASSYRFGSLGFCIQPDPSLSSNGSALFAVYDTSVNQVRLGMMGMTNSGLVTGGFSQTNALFTQANIVPSSLRVYPLSNPLSASTHTLLLTYVYNNPTFQVPAARIISGTINSGATMTVGSEISLNSTSPVYAVNGPANIISYDSSINTIFATQVTSASSSAPVSIQGTGAASLSSPQPFVLGSTLTPVQTGTCVGVALTAASAGGTGKILVRGTAEVRSTLPNMPGALSFNHANYGTPGGIRGSVAGRTVTFEGIDG